MRYPNETDSEVTDAIVGCVSIAVAASAGCVLLWILVGVFLWIWSLV